MNQRPVRTASINEGTRPGWWLFMLREQLCMTQCSNGVQMNRSKRFEHFGTLPVAIWRFDTQCLAGRYMLCVL